MKLTLVLRWMLILLAISLGIAQADTSISNLPAASALSGTEAIPIVQAGTTVKTTPGALKTYIAAPTGLTCTPANGLTCSVANPTGPTIGLSIGVSPSTLSANTATVSFTLANPRLIYGNSFNGSADLNQIIASTFGGTGNGYVRFGGPATTEKLFTLPDANATLLYSGGAGDASALTGTASGLTAGYATALATARLIAGHSFDGTGDVAVTGSDVGLSAVTDDAQTKAAIVPNTVPSAAQILVGNASSTAYAPVSLSGPVSITASGTTTVATLNQNTTGSAATLTTPRAIAGHPFDGSAAISITASDVGAVPTTRTVNGHALSANVTVTAADVGAPSGSGTSSGTNTGDQDLSGLMAKASNLSDVVSVSTARTNLGLGTMATQNAAAVAITGGTATGVSVDSSAIGQATPAAVKATTGEVTQQLLFSGTLTPAALAGDANDYNPTNLATASALRIDGGAADRNLTGLSGGVDGRIVTITNVGATNALTLNNQNTGSLAANRFLLPADTVLPINTAIALRYDGTSSRWRPWSRALANTGVTAGAYGDASHVATFTTDAQGRLTAAANTAISLPTSGLTGTLQAAQFPALAGDATTSAGSLTVTLANTAVSAGTCTSCNLTVDAKGRITAQASGSGGGLTVASTTITGGTTSRVIYDNAGVVGESTATTDSSGNVTIPSGAKLHMNAANDTVAIDFGGTTSSFPSLRRHGSALDVLVADASNFAQLRADIFTAINRFEFNGASLLEMISGAVSVINNANSAYTPLRASGIGLMGTSNLTMDLNIERSAAGKAEFNNGTLGTYRDFIARQAYIDYTNTSTVGAVTINKAAGQAIVAASGTSVVVTDSLVTASSQVFCTIAQNDATAVLKNCVAGSGTFTITLSVAATANTAINFFVLNQ